jgi:hypothetical protein
MAQRKNQSSVLTSEIVEREVVEKAEGLASYIFSIPHDDCENLGIKVDKISYVNQDWINSNYTHATDEKILLICMSNWNVDMENVLTAADTLYMETFKVLYPRKALELPDYGVYRHGMGSGHAALEVDPVFPEGTSLEFNYRDKPDDSIYESLCWDIEEMYKDDPYRFVEGFGLDEDTGDYDIGSEDEFKEGKLIIRNKFIELLEDYKGNNGIPPADE